MTFDPKVFDLASQFLEDHPGINTEAARITLAQAIQLAIDEELEFMREQLMERA